MESKAKLLGHPIHPMLIVFPLGLLATAVIFDVVALAMRNGAWSGIAFYLIAAGVIGGVAAVFGMVDWLAIPSGTRAKAIGLWHGAGNVVVVLLFGLSWFLRRETPNAPGDSGPDPVLGGRRAGAGDRLAGRRAGGSAGGRWDDGAHLDAPVRSRGDRRSHARPSRPADCRPRPPRDHVGPGDRSGLP